VNEAKINSLRRILWASEYRSADSSPALYAHTLPVHCAPQAIGLCTLSSVLLFALFAQSRHLREVFPQGDILFSNYAGNYSIPLRVFFIGFFTGFASAIDAPWRARLRFGLHLIFSFVLFCAVFDLCHSLIGFLAPVQASHFVAQLATALAGFLLFSLFLLENADLPPLADAPVSNRYEISSVIIVLSVLLLSGAVSLAVANADLTIIEKMRSLALLGGVNIGIFLLVPLAFFILNIIAAVQALFSPTPADNPDVTLIIPAFNEAHLIEALVANTAEAAAEYSGGVNVILVDNNSTDETAALATASFEKTNGIRWKVLSEPRQGKAFALNRALAMVETDYFARLDADTLVSGDTLQRTFSLLCKKNTGVVGALALPPGGGLFDGSREIEVLLKMGYDQVALGAIDAVFGIPGMFACYLTKAARDVGGFATGINGEDTDIALRIGESGYHLVVDPEATYISEVPRTFRHLREQRHRWFRSVFHVAARNRNCLFPRRPSSRGWLVLPYMLINSARRAMALPLLLFASLYLAFLPHERESTITAAAVIALLLGAPFLNAIVAIIVNHRLKAAAFLGPYIFFRMLRSYFTLEALLSLNFNTYAKRQGPRSADHIQN